MAKKCNFQNQHTVIHLHCIKTLIRRLNLEQILTTQVSITKNRKNKCTHEKLEDQIINAKKSHHKKYQKSGVQNNKSNADIESNSYTDTDNIVSLKN